MKRTHISFPISDYGLVKQQLLNWTDRFELACFLDNHSYELPHHSVDCLVGAGSLQVLKANAGNAFDQLKAFSAQYPDWLFGHFAFDLKNETEQLSSSHEDHIGFPDLCFFVPEVVVELKRESIRIGAFGSGHQDILQSIIQVKPKQRLTKKKNTVRERFSKTDYVSTIENLQKHILYGDCYEINFCQEFYSDEAFIDPASTYEELSETSPMPFGAYYKLGDKYLLCASPERYLKKEGQLLVSQPIKGTEPRDREDPVIDLQHRQKLFHSAKDRSENIMVVDLVRNDLSRICEEGSIKVDELYGIYSFPQVHQMISSVSGILPLQTHWVEAVRATFPMGSMTGAPKKRVLELIERYERTRRGLFSGAVGYISPSADFDFNVVIRSILYNETNHYLSYQVGSAITFYSIPENEYDECLLKARAIRKVLGLEETA